MTDTGLNTNTNTVNKTKSLPPWATYYMGIKVANKYINHIDIYKWK